MTQFITLASLYNIPIVLVKSEYNVEEDEKKKIELKNCDDICSDITWKLWHILRHGFCKWSSMAYSPHFPLTFTCCPWWLNHNLSEVRKTMDCCRKKLKYWCTNPLAQLLELLLISKHCRITLSCTPNCLTALTCWVKWQKKKAKTWFNAAHMGDTCPISETHRGQVSDTCPHILVSDMQTKRHVPIWTCQLLSRDVIGSNMICILVSLHLVPIICSVCATALIGDSLVII